MDRPKRVKFVPKRLRDNEKDAKETERNFPKMQSDSNVLIAIQTMLENDIRS